MPKQTPNKLNFDYDRDSDVLYISIGDPEPGRGEHFDDDILLRYSLATGDLIGLTILGLRDLGGIDEVVRRLRVTSSAATAVVDQQEAITQLVYA